MRRAGEIKVMGISLKYDVCHNGIINFCYDPTTAVLYDVLYILGVLLIAHLIILKINNRLAVWRDLPLWFEYSIFLVLGHGQEDKGDKQIREMGNVMNTYDLKKKKKKRHLLIWFINKLTKHLNRGKQNHIQMIKYTINNTNMICGTTSSPYSSPTAYPLFQWA